MNRWQNISIRNKLVLMQVFTSILVLGIFLAAFVVTEVNGYKTRKVANLVGIADVAGSNCISAIQFMDSEAALQILRELQAVTPDLLQATVLDKKGHVFAAVKASGITKPADSTPSTSITFSTADLSVKRPIATKEEVLGSIYLSVSLNELHQMQRSILFLSLILSAVAILTAFLIANVVQGYISSRLLNLVAVVRRINEPGDFQQALVDESADEIGILTQAFKALLEHLQENDKRKDEFIGVASHELRTPLTSIKGYLDLLRSIETQQPNQQFVEKAFSNVQKLEKLIKDLLDVSKIQSGQLSLNLSPVNLSQLVEETVVAFQTVTQTHSIKLTAQSASLIVVADPQRIEQVMYNLLSNAVKYSPDQDSIVVFITADEKNVNIGVRDFGPGIRHEEESKIFERFYRANNDQKNISGFGLGLYICKDIIERHSGKIWVTRQEEGSLFQFSLPLAGEAQAMKFVN